MPFFRGFISKVYRRNKVSECISKKGGAPMTAFNQKFLCMFHETRGLRIINGIENKLKMVEQ
jgi:hypothetical protein